MLDETMTWRHYKLTFTLIHHLFWFAFGTIFGSVVAWLLESLRCGS